MFGDHKVIRICSANNQLAFGQRHWQNHVFVANCFWYQGANAWVGNFCWVFDEFQALCTCERTEQLFLRQETAFNQDFPKHLALRIR